MSQISVLTCWNAQHSIEEAETGSIEVGKAADLIVLDRNLFEVPPHDIHKVKVVLTLLEGKEVYRDPTFASPRTASGR